MAESFFQKIKNEPLTRELAQKIIKETKGEARGAYLENDAEFILKKKRKKEAD